jgi:hypothetical protein
MTLDHNERRTNTSVLRLIVLCMDSATQPTTPPHDYENIIRKSSDVLFLVLLSTDNEVYKLRFKIGQLTVFTHWLTWYWELRNAKWCNYRPFNSVYLVSKSYRLPARSKQRPLPTSGLQVYWWVPMVAIRVLQKVMLHSESSLLGALDEEKIMSYVKSMSVSVRDLVSATKQLVKFSWKFGIGAPYKSCRISASFVKIGSVKSYFTIRVNEFLPILSTFLDRLGWNSVQVIAT